MLYTQILTIGSVIGATPSFDKTISVAVTNGIIRHFDHISDLPTTPFYRTPQENETYLEFQHKQYDNSLACNQALDDVEWNVTDPYTLDKTILWPRIVSDLSWPQVEGVLLRNVYPQYIAIHGGVRQFCILRRHFAKTEKGAPDDPRDREWGPYRCTVRKPDGSYKKFISTRAGPERKYKPILNLVDIRSQADYFGPMYQQLALDSDIIPPIGKWQNNRPITNFTRNDIIEKYNVIKFYNAEHELFNDNSRLRLLGASQERTGPITLGNDTRKGTMQEVDTMSPTYAILTGGPYSTSVMKDDVDHTWTRRNLVPNYITRSHKSGFMRTGNLLADGNIDVIYAMDYPGYSRYCCTNSAPGYEGYNPEDGRKKGVGYMYQPSYAPFFLAIYNTTCDSAVTSCSEVYTPWFDFDTLSGVNEEGFDRIAQYIQVNDDEDVTYQTASDPIRQKADQATPATVEPKLFVYLYSGNQMDLIKSKHHENSFSIKYYNGPGTFTEHKNAENWFWEVEPHIFNCKSKFGETVVTVNYECSSNQFLRNKKEFDDASSYMSPYSDYQDAWKNSEPYKDNVGNGSAKGFMSDTFEMDKYYNDFEHNAQRSTNIDCTVPIDFKQEAGEKQCDFRFIQPDTVDQSYSYNQYFSVDLETEPYQYRPLQRKHTIKDIRKESDCKSIVIDVEADCGQASDNSNLITEITHDIEANVQETNYWEYQSRCAAIAWDKIYDVMFTPKLTSDWSQYTRSEYTKP